MNKYTLKFLDPQLEIQYFNDQINGLLFYFRWVSYLASASAFSVIIMEFISPFGFENYLWLLFVIPIGFTFGYFLVKRYNNLFNLYLALMNISLGFFIDILLIIYMDSQVLFLAGQTVALIQFALMMGTNFLLNVGIFCFNNFLMMALDSYFKKYFKSLQTMFFLAIIMMIISYWTSEKLKREYFFLKYSDKQLQISLDKAFKINILQCQYNPKEIKIKFIEGKEERQNNLNVISQESFTLFIRNIILENQNFQHIYRSSVQSEKKLLTLEQFLFYAFTDIEKCEHKYRQLKPVKFQKKDKIFALDTYQQGRDGKRFQIQLFHTVVNGKVQIVLMIQDFETQQYQNKNSQLKVQIRKLQNLHKKMHEVIEKNIVFCVQNNRKIQTQNEQQQLIKIQTHYKMYKTIQASINIMLYIKDNIDLTLCRFTLQNLFQSIFNNIGEFLKDRFITVNFINLIQDELLTDYKLLYHLLMNFIANYIDQEQSNHSNLDIHFQLESNITFDQDFLYHNQNALKDMNILNVKLKQSQSIECERYFQSLNSPQDEKWLGLGIQQNLRIIECLGPQKNINIYEEDGQWVQEFLIYCNMEILKSVIPGNIQMDMSNCRRTSAQQIRPTNSSNPLMEFCNRQ